MQIEAHELVNVVRDLAHAINDARPVPPQVSPQVVPDRARVANALVEALPDRKIECIKLFRIIFGDGLKESKDWIESVGHTRSGW